MCILSKTSDHLFDFQNLVDHALKTDPLEGRLSAVGHLRLANQANRLQHIGDVVEAPDLGLKKLFIENFAI